MGNRLSHMQQEAMLRRSMDVLRKVKEQTGNIVWLSAEPVSWDLTSVLDIHHPLDWIVIGAASKGRQYFQPATDHIKRLLMLMDETHTPVFYKGNIKPLFKTQDLGGPDLNRWREDFPCTDRSGHIIPAVQRRKHHCGLYGWTISREYLTAPPPKTPAPNAAPAPRVP